MIGTSLRRRLVLTYTALIMIILLSAGLFLLNHISDVFIEALTRDLTTRTAIVRDLALTNAWPWSDNATGDQIAAQLAAVADSRITVIGLDGTVLAESTQPSVTMVNHADRPEFVAALAEGIGVSQRYSESAEERMMYLALPMTVDGLGTVAVARLSISMEWVWARLDAIRNGLIVALGGSLLIAASLGLTLGSRLITKPLNQVVAGARALLSGNLGARIDIATGDEWQVLASSLNQMAISLERQISHLSDERNRLRNSLERLPDGVLLIGPGGSLLFANRRARQWLRLAESAGEYHPERALPNSPRNSSVAAQTVRQGQAVDLLARSLQLREFVQQALSGEPIPSREMALRGPGSAVLEVTANWVGAPRAGDLVVVLHDVSEIRRLDTARRDLVANVSHELKTPIGAIRVLAESLHADPLAEPAVLADFLGRIIKETERLTRLVDEMLYLSRLESEVDPLSLVTADLTDLLRSAVQALSPLAKAKGIHIDVTSGGDTGLRCDPHRIESAIKALLDNAVKFAPPGSVIKATASPLAEEVELVITDQGPGIPEDAVGRIFERFYKADESRGGAGSGLGLAIVKHVIQSHGGRVFVHSVVGRGSTFGFTLPRRQP